jgi:predicted transcriptional regulator
MARNDVTIVSAQVSTTTRAHLERLARESDRTVSAEIRRALREHLEHEQQQPAEQGAQ